jgi:hypothetical protein
MACLKKRPKRKSVVEDENTVRIVVRISQNIFIRIELAVQPFIWGIRMREPGRTNMELF